MDFEAHRDQLRGVAYRMLGSLADAEDAVQETWLRMARADTTDVRNPGGWLRTVLSRVCLDMLRQRSRAEPVPDPDPLPGADEEFLLAEDVGRALLVVLDRLSPDERVAFVLHDVFAVPFGEIAPVVDRSTATTKKLASRARAKVRGVPAEPVDVVRHRRVIEAFLAAARVGDVETILAVLHPDVARRADGRPEMRGARSVAEEIVVFGRDAPVAELVLVDGGLGLVIAPRGCLRSVIRFTVDGDLIGGYELISEPGRLRGLQLALVPPDLP
ncbi:sigma-70 family RNA polymerase sigma factor [Amycolatopsis endophytica]|uniref:RNA polymerase sigma-70 factor (ECF subfamily) n=1 Tax=Amycolatopsis endophytica TaxID=860233 RepID=A0A853BCR7_9PSEU|nr:sigma-70 family RNA polymerase sigma factor [Amycolatopsis endophytica]NYI92544.1 RNA polymerase sigma-70 factor (ECF subfamily) [Amycolatopsis endophytica]